MTFDVIPATDARLDALVTVLGRAFVDDPMTRWPLSSGGDMIGRVETMFRLMYGPLIETAAYEVPDARGFAVWVPPGATEAMFESDARIRSQLAPLTDDGATRYANLWSWIEDHVPDEPVWYLDAIGVDPDHQGTGVGTALIRDGLGRAARDGVPAFLETARAELLDYYRRFGFDVVEDGEHQPGGPHVWFMRAEPSATVAT